MNVWEIHPALVHFPIAFLLAAVVLDLFAVSPEQERRARVVDGLLVAGVLTALVTAVAGLVAYYTVPAHTERAHTLMLWHLWLNVTTVVLFAAVALVRWRRMGPAPAWSHVVGWVATIILVVSAYLGGQIVYHGGAGVDPNLLTQEVREGHSHSHGHSHSTAAHGGGQSGYAAASHVHNMDH